MRRIGLVMAALGLPGYGPAPEAAPSREPSRVAVKVTRANPAPPRQVESGGSDRQAEALAAARPAWEARPVAADAKAVPAGDYVVASGDTLCRIADRTGAAAEAIARANGIAAPYAVRVGQRLRVPAGRYHLVRGGHTGIAIARAYGVEWSRIVTANGLTEPYDLRVGQRLAIPETRAGRSRAAERAAAFSLDVEDLLTGAQPAAIARAPRRPAVAPRRLPATTPIVAPARVATGFAWPVDGRVVKRFRAAAAGERSDGIKIAVPPDTPVKAAADGIVAYAGSGIAALGGLVIVRHGGGWASVYGHAAKLLVRRGQAVRRGDTIARSGSTGRADRPEVHFELRKGRAAVDPLGQLPRT